MNKQKFSISKRFKSFKYAFNGLKILIVEEHNARIHLFASICVIIAGFLLKISIAEWIACCFAIALVITTEIINSSIENMADFITKEKYIAIKKIKDLAAAAVLITSIAAAIIGILIFLPRIIDLFA